MGPAAVIDRLNYSVAAARLSKRCLEFGLLKVVALSLLERFVRQRPEIGRLLSARASLIVKIASANTVH